MTLTEIEYGSLASSATLNNNFQYLQDKITELSALITSETSGYSSTVATLNNSISDLLGYKDSFIPVGAVIPVQDKVIPSGFLLCDGSELKVTDYADLYAVLGSTYGQTDSTKFNIPDLRGLTLFGASSSTTLGQKLASAIPNIKGQINTWANFTSVSGAFSSTSSGTAIGGSGSWASGVAQAIFDASKSSSVYSNDATTVQPPAIVTNFVIKY